MISNLLERSTFKSDTSSQTNRSYFNGRQAIINMQIAAAHYPFTGPTTFFTKEHTTEMCICKIGPTHLKSNHKLPLTGA
jgi:hypothetical protein